MNDEEAIDYFQRYLGRFNIDIYWGSTQQFVSELHSRWQTHQQGQEDWDDWDDDDW